MESYSMARWLFSCELQLEYTNSVSKIFSYKKLSREKRE